MRSTGLVYSSLDVKPMYNMASLLLGYRSGCEHSGPQLSTRDHDGIFLRALTWRLHANQQTQDEQIQLLVRH